MAATGKTFGKAVVSGAVFIGNTAPTATDVTVSDNNGEPAFVGDTLTGNYTFNDVDNDLEGNSIYRWLRNGSEINGATDVTYTLVAADSGQVITFEVTPVPVAGTEEGAVAVISSNSITVVNSVPLASNVSISDVNGGNIVVGDSLTGNYTYSDVDEDSEGESTFRWLRNGAVISGATTTAYTLVAADSETNITFEVTPVAATGASPGAPVRSALVTVINSAPTATDVSVSDINGGAPVVGDTLSGSYTYNDIDADAEGLSTFGWRRNGISINGATDINYTLVAADSGQDITFEVTPVAATGVTPGATVVSANAITVINSPPTAGAVNITDDNGGSIVVGDTLTGSYVYDDIDGDVEGTSTFRWLRNGTAINGANDIKYTLVAADSGQDIRFEVTPVALGGVSPGTAVASDAVTVINSAPVASSVNITDGNGGSIIVGDTLTGNYIYNDVDGDPEGASTFRWLRGGTAITGATAASYTLVAADSGQDIRFEVTPVAATGDITGLPVESPAVTVINSMPEATNVSITDTNGGDAVVGDLLTGSYNYSDPDGDLEGSSTFRWLRNGTAITGATATGYTLVTADSGQAVSFEVTPVAATGDTTGIAVQSAAITVVNSPPTAANVSITDANGGSIVVGDTLTGNYEYSDVDDDPEGVSVYRWLRNGSEIIGATASSYTLVTADSGNDISFEVTPVAATGVTTGAPVISANVFVDNSAPVATAVSIVDNNGGDALVGDQLTGIYTYSDADGDAEGASFFRWLRNGSAIPGANTTSYTLVAADSGETITFEVVPVALTGVLTGDVAKSGGVVIGNTAPTASNVTISDNNGGNIVVGVTLSGSYTYFDADGDAEGTSTFRWLRNGVAISGATATSYTLVAADSGQSVTFEVIPVAATGTTTGTAVSAPAVTVLNSAPVATNVSVTDVNGGDIVVGDTLTGAYTYSDVDGDAEGSSGYQWLRNGSEIAGATALTYTLVATDSGQDIRFRVTPVAVSGITTGAAVTSPAVTVINTAPTANTVTITDNNGGDPVVGDTLTGSYIYNDIDGDPEGASTYRWLRNNVAISGATATSYVLVAADSGLDISFEVTPVAASGNTTGNAVSSTAITVVNSPPVAGAVSIVDDNGGNALVGDTLTGTYIYSDPDGDEEGVSSYQWLRNGAPIAAATTTTYTLVTEDSGQAITFVVTPAAMTGITTGTAVSSPAVTVENSAPVASNVDISDVNGGNVIVGDTLTGNYTYTDADADAEGVSSFRWLRNGAPVAGATGSSYTLVAEDSGQLISFEVTPVAVTGIITGLPVESAAVTVINSVPTAGNVSITDDNGGDPVVGDSLTGSYTYTDIDGDIEGSSIYRWLRNGLTISGATGISYNLVTEDSGQDITFEVTPVAQTGDTTGAPVVSGNTITVINSAPTASNVSVSDDNGGDTVVGDTLTGTYTYNDVDGDAEGTSIFRWLRNGVEITGETAFSYTLVAADSGQSISFEVTPVALGGVTTGTAVVSENALTVINSAPVASNVSVVDGNGGDAIVGDVLTGDYTYSDIDGDPEGSSVYQWLRNGSPITGATATTYTLVAEDSGQAISFEVTPVAASGATTGITVVSDNTITVVNSAPTAAAVSITDTNGGDPVVGDTLTASYTYNDLDGDPEGASIYRWLRGNIEIAGASGMTYTLVATDSGEDITFEVTPVAVSGNTTGTPVASNAITVINTAPTAANVSITDTNGGDALVGDVLSASYTYADIDGDAEGSSIYQWLRNGTAISGASATTYTLVTADSGQTISFEVTPVALTGATPGVTVVSGNSFNVLNSAPTASDVSITDDNGGSIIVGDTLSGNYTYNDVDNDPEGTSTYRWLRGGSAIAGATASTYTLIAEDSGQAISFEVTPVAATGIATGVPVESAAVTVINSPPTAGNVSITDDNGGDPVVGDTLTASYTYADIDGDTEGSSIYRWLRNGATISGANTTTYTLVAADSGEIISFEVTPVALTGTTTGDPVVSGNSFTVVNSAPVASNVSITDTNGGEALVGDTLIGNYTYEDLDNDAEGASVYQWLRNGTPIAGATTTIYTLVTADSGQTIAFEVTPVALAGVLTGITVRSGDLVIGNTAPTASGVSITDPNGDSIVVGDTLTGTYTYNDVDGDAEGTSTFRWLRGGTAITGATAISYTLVTADSGQAISFEVTPVAATGTTTGLPVESATVTVVNSAPTAAAVTVTDANGGDVVVGDILTGNYTYADVDGDLEGASTFRWLRNGTAITGATGENYTLVAADSGANISFEVTPVAATGVTTGLPVESAVVAVINSPPVASNVGITDINAGNIVVGDTLTGAYTYSDVDGDAEGSSTFRWLRDGAAISGATSISYTLVAADSGTNISFEVTPVAATGDTTGTAVESAAVTVVNSPPTAGSVSISDDNGGSIIVGDSLTGSYVYNDVDGDIEGTTTFRWLRDGTAITGATTTSYLLVTEDSGKTITFEVTPVATTGVITGTAVVSSGVVVDNSPPVAENVSITDNNGGSVVVGDTLGGSYTYSDVDGDAEGASTFRWLRNGTAIAGETGTSYTLVAADSGQAVSFEVTPVAVSGDTTGLPVESVAITVSNSPPTASSVIITDANGGNVVVGDVLTGSYVYDDVDGDAEGASTFRWLRDGIEIAGETTTSYTLVTADSGTNISFEVTPVAVSGDTTGLPVESAAVTVINSPPVASNVTITDDNGGDVVVGDSLTGSYSYSDVDGDLEGVSTFRWLRDGVAITGATALSYTLVANDSDASISFEVTPVADTGTTTGTAVESAAVTVINSAPVASNVSITDANGGSIVVGDTLTGGYDYSDVDGDLEGTSTFRWLRDGSPISGETATSYTLVTADSGADITFEVTPVAATGTTTGTPVSSAAVTVVNSAPVASNVTITDGNGAYAVEGDVLTGSYTYSDVDGDLEGASTFRWLRDGVAISGATSIDYTLVADDITTQITLEVTPVAQSGILTGLPVLSNVIATGTAPVVTGYARYLDSNRNGINDVNDQLIVPFDQAVSTNAVDSSDFALAVTGDSFGTGATVAAGPASNEITITLGTTPALITAGDFSDAVTTSGSPSGIDVAATMLPDAIESASGIDATPSSPVDMIPAYVDSQQALGSNDSWSSALGDIDGDGDLDMVVANINSQPNRVWTNDGAGNFTDSGQTLGTGTSRSVALADIDNDGDLDIVVANDGGGNTVWTNDGAGNFSDTLQSLGTGASWSVTLVDVDADTDLDMVVANLNQANRIWLSDGTGAFTDSGQTMGTAASRSIAVDDIDNDGDPDLVVANDGGANTVWTNNGTGVFTDSGQALGTGASQGIALGDVDGDTDLDIVVANDGAGNTVWLNDGTGAFTDSGLALGSNASLFVVLADIDGDSDLDMLVANRSTANRVWQNDGNGNFADSGQLLGSGYSTSLAIDDIDGDTDPDMVVTNAAAEANRVYSGSLAGTQ